MSIRMPSLKVVLALLGVLLLVMAGVSFVYQQDPTHLTTKLHQQYVSTSDVDTRGTLPGEDNKQLPEEIRTDSIHNITGVLSRIRMCTQTERLEHMKKVCTQRYDVNRPGLIDPVGRSLVDFKHNMTFCWMSKAGGTSLKAFILEANGLDLSDRERQEDSLNLVHFVETVNKYGLKQMHQIDKKIRWTIVKSFFNTMGIRHPFDRLVAYYRDKIIDTDRSSNHPERVKEILKEFRPEVFKNNKTLAAMQWPQEAVGFPSFGEVMTWVYRHKVMDEHWNFISEVCHPCAHDWGAIFRVETMEMDGHLLAQIVNSTRPGVPVRHSHQHNPNFSQFGKTLDLFSGVPDDVIDYLLEFYRTDMMMFGYKWDRDSHTAYCSIDTPDGPCC